MHGDARQTRGTKEEAIKSEEGRLKKRRSERAKKTGKYMHIERERARGKYWRR